MVDIKGETKNLEREVKKRLTTYIGAGLGLVAGLAWNDAIRSLIESLFPKSENTILAKFIYALVLTITIVIIIVYLERIIARNREASPPEKK